MFDNRHSRIVCMSHYTLNTLFRFVSFLIAIFACFLFGSPSIDRSIDRSDRVKHFSFGEGDSQHFRRPKTNRIEKNSQWFWIQIGIAIRRKPNKVFVFFLSTFSINRCKSETKINGFSNEFNCKVQCGKIAGDKFKCTRRQSAIKLELKSKLKSKSVFSLNLEHFWSVFLTYILVWCVCTPHSLFRYRSGR